MEDDIDIYADLPAFDPKQDSGNKNDQSCNCTEIKNNFDLLMSKFEKIQKSKEILERNLSSLLKTAKLEIARKDKMIENLRKRLDDITFKRNSKNESSVHSAHRSSYQQQNYENVTLTYSNEIESEPQQIDLYHDRYESKKQNDHSNQKLTLFGERLQKRIMENEKEKKNQLALSKSSTEPSVINISEENVVESDKENGSQSGVNNKSNELTVTTQNSDSETSRKKNSEKRKNSDDNMRETKHLKLDDNREKTNETDNCITRYDLKNDLAEYEADNNVDFDNRSDTGHSVRSKRYTTRSKTVSEHEDAKEDQDSATTVRNHTQKRREESNSAKDYNGRRFTESLKSFRTASTSSNHVSERSNSSYKKNGYRYTSPKRSRSRSRSDYETSSRHRSQERSKKSYRDSRHDDYRDSKYDDYRDSKYDNYKNRKHDDYRDSKYDDYSKHDDCRDNNYDDVRHKSDRSKRIYDIKESERSNRRCSSGERDLRNKLKTSASDVEDRGSVSSYGNKKTYEIRGTRRCTKVAEENASDNKKLDKNSRAATKIDLRPSPDRTVAKDSEQHRADNKSDTKAANSIENTVTRAAENSNLEEGEILDSPEKKSDSANRTSEDAATKKTNVEIVPIGDKIEEILPVSVHETAIGLETNAINAEQVEKVTDIKQDEAASRLPFAKDCAETTQSSSPIKTNAVLLQTQTCESDVCEFHIDKDLNSDSTAHHVEIVASERMCDKNIDNDVCKSCASEKLPSSVVVVVAKLVDENKDGSNTESVNETEEINNLVKDVDKKKETNKFDDDNRIHKLDVKEATSCATEIVDQAALNCDKDKNQVSTESDVCHQALEDKSNVEMSHLCLRDHNYVQNSVTFDHEVLSVQQTSSVSSECNKDASETAMKKSKAAETVNAQSNGVKKTSLSASKSKKDQLSTGVIISRRRRAVTLSDNNASMTVLKNTTVEKASSVANEPSDSTLKPRACKASRSKVIM